MSLLEAFVAISVTAMVCGVIGFSFWLLSRDS